MAVLPVQAPQKVFLVFLGEPQVLFVLVGTLGNRIEPLNTVAPVTPARDKIASPPAVH